VMDMVNRVHRDQRGLVGKFMIVWLLLLALIVVVGYDAVSIAITTFKTSDVAAQAASDGVVAYRHERDLAVACAAAQASITAAEPDLKLGKNFCTGDPDAVTITITIRTTADTFALGRLDFTKHYTIITQTETAGESAV
jgi:Tfp pilus assembly protein PilX